MAGLIPAIPTITPTPTLGLLAARQDSASYIPPTTPPVTRFEPAPTCLPTTAGDKLWLVSGLCYAYPGNDVRPWPSTLSPRPGCTYTRAGNPAADNNACNPNWWTTDTVGADGATLRYGECPAGYTTAGVYFTYKPFDSTSYGLNRGDPSTAFQYDVTHTRVGCCPEVDGLEFKFRDFGNVYTSSTTFYEGYHWEMEVPIPFCYAHPVTALDGKEVTMRLYNDGRTFDRRRRGLKRQADSEVNSDDPWGFGTRIWGETGETTTAVFDADVDTIWAEDIGFDYTVFHGTHTCFENCGQYFEESYHITNPNPPATTESSDAAEPTDDGNANGGGDGSDDQGNGSNTVSLPKSSSPSTTADGNENSNSNLPDSGASSLRLGTAAWLSVFATGLLYAVVWM